MKVRRIQTTFQLGEIDPTALGREDIEGYGAATKALRNWLIRTAGSIERRPGTIDRAAIAARPRLYGYTYTDGVSYVLAFSAGQVQIYSGTTGGLIQTIGGCPWLETDLDTLTFTSRGNVITVCHPTFAPRQLTRTTATTFALSTFAFQLDAGSAPYLYQPYYKFVDAAVTLALSGVTGSVTATASAAAFSSAYVGQRLRWKSNQLLVTGYTSPTQLTVTVCDRDGVARVDPGDLPVETWRPESKYAVGDVVLYNNIYYECVVAHTATQIAPPLATARSLTRPSTASVTLNGDGVATTYTLPEGWSPLVSDTQVAVTVNGLALPTSDYSVSGGSINFSVAPAAGTGNIRVDLLQVSMTDTTNFTANTALWQTLPTAKLTTTDWGEPAYSSIRGWPAACTHYQQRLVFGGGSLPNGITSSKTGAYTVFDVGNGDDADSVQFDIDGDAVPVIHHLLATRSMLVFTNQGEYAVPGGTPFVPTQARIERQTPHGILQSCRPIQLGDAAVFVQETGQSVRRFAYNDQQGGYSTQDMIAGSVHLLTGPKGLTYNPGTTARAEQQIYVINSDGTLAVGHLSETGLVGWTPWTTAGRFEDVVALDGKVWVAAFRNGVYRLEEMAGSSYDCPLDGAVNLTSAGTKAWTSALHAGQTADVVSRTGGLMWLGQVAVGGGGAFTTLFAATDIWVGSTYEARVEVLPIQSALPTGATTGLKRRIAAVYADLYLSSSLSINGQELVIRTAEGDPSLPPSAYTGIWRFRLLGHTREGGLTITQPEPLPATIRALAYEVRYA